MNKLASFLARFIPLLFLSLWLVGCGQPEMPPSPTPTANPSVTEAVPVDLQASPTATPAATATPAPTTTTPPPPPSPTLELEDTLILYAVLQGQNWALEAYPDQPAFNEEVFDAFYGPEARMEGVRRYTDFNFGPQLSPNGRYLLLPGLGGYGGPDNTGLWFVNLQTNDVRQLLPRAKVFTWSPNGDQITYVEGDTLYTLSVAEGAEPRPLFSHPDLWELYARWSPDGSTIATMFTAQGELDETGFPKLTDTYWLVDANSGQASEIAERPGFAIEHVAEEMTWSPNGRYLLVRSELFTRNGDVLPTEFPGGAHWLPVPEALPESEQEKLLVNDQNGLRIMTIDGQEVTRISDEYVHPWVFSNNGRFLAYLDPQTESDLLIFDLQSHETMRLDPSPIQVGALRWSSNDNYLLLDERGRSGSIWALAVQPGSQPQMVLENGVLLDAFQQPITLPTINCPNPETDDMVGTLVEDGSVSIYTNPVLGIEITSAGKLCVHEPDYLSISYGFVLSDPEVWEGTLFSANWLYQATPDELETIVQQVINSYPELEVNRESITVNGREGVMLWPLPGTDTTTQIYLAANDRLYHLIFWNAPLDNQAQTLLDGLRFLEPTQSLDSLNLPPAE
jgi:hypothetical protein